MSSLITPRINSVKVGIKEPVDVVTTENITLSGLTAIEGTTLEAGYRALVAAQEDKSENGIYDVLVGSWTRSTDFNAANDVTSGVLVTCPAVTDGFFQITFTDNEFAPDVTLLTVIKYVGCECGGWESSSATTGEGIVDSPGAPPVTSSNSGDVTNITGKIESDTPLPDGTTVFTIDTDHAPLCGGCMPVSVYDRWTNTYHVGTLVIGTDGATKIYGISTLEEPELCINGTINTGVECTPESSELPLLNLIASSDGGGDASKCIQWFEKSPPWALQVSKLGTYPSWDDVWHLAANIDRSIIAFRYNMSSTGYLATIDRDDGSITTLGTVTAVSTNFTNVIVDPLGVWVGTGNGNFSSDPGLQVRRIDTGATLFNSADFASYGVGVSPEGNEVAVANGGSGADVRIYKPLDSWNEDTITYDFDDINPDVVGVGVLQRVWSVAYSPDGQYLATGQMTYLSAFSNSWNPVLLWDRTTGDRVNLLSGLPTKPSDAASNNDYRVRDIKFSPNGKYIAFCFQGSGTDNEFGWNVGVWDMRTGSMKYQIATSGTHYHSRLDWSPDSKYLACSGSGNPLGNCPVVYDMVTGLVTANDNTVGAVANSNSVVFI